MTGLFDIFLSYQLDNKDNVILLFNRLKTYNYKVWIDIEELKARDLREQVEHGIVNSNLFICCITRKYCESKICWFELNTAINNNKETIALMFEDINITELGEIGQLINSTIRYNTFKEGYDNLNWTSNYFQIILNDIDSKIKNKMNAGIKVLFLKFFN